MEPSLFLRRISHCSIFGKPNSKTDGWCLGLLYCRRIDFCFELFVAETMWELIIAAGILWRNKLVCFWEVKFWEHLRVLVHFAAASSVCVHFCLFSIQSRYSVNCSFPSTKWSETCTTIRILLTSVIWGTI